MLYLCVSVIDDYSIVFAKSQKKVKQSTDIIKVNLLVSGLIII